MPDLMFVDTAVKKSNIVHLMSLGKYFSKITLSKTIRKAK